MRDTADDKSRSQKKRESAAAQKLGAALAALSEKDLLSMDLPSALREAIVDWKNFPGHEARRRQMQYIGKLMREADADALREKLELHLASGRAATMAFHEAEAVRERLVTADDAALERELAALAEEKPDLPVARLRHLARTARDERAKKRPPKAYRELFRLLKTSYPGAL